MNRSVYITRLAAFLPNAPVANDQMEGVLGQVGDRPSRARAVVLRSNGIENRHYAIDPTSGATTHSNAQLTATAVRGLAGDGFELAQMQVLACGTSSPDQFAPNHAVMVHGELGSPPCEVMAASGICVSGVMSLKYGYMSVLAGLSENAVVTGSEASSSHTRAWHYEAENAAQVAALEKKPVVAFEKDFLRWMLSDGAGAALLQEKPNEEGLSLRGKDVDFARNCLVIRSGKGDKDRETVLPEKAASELERHLVRVRTLHDRDRGKSLPGVWMPEALERKYRDAAKEWSWFWVFPSEKLSIEPRSGVVRRYHVHPTTFQRAFHQAVKRSGIPKHATVHTLRHYAEFRTITG